MVADKPDMRKVLEHYGIETNEFGKREASVLCPVHSQNRPSCTFNEDDGLIYCAACGFGGDSWSLIQEKEGFQHEFSSAVAWAEEHLGFVSTGVSRSAGEPPRREGISGKPGSGFRPQYKPRSLRRSGIATS